MDSILGRPLRPSPIPPPPQQAASDEPMEETMEVGGELLRTLLLAGVGAHGIAAVFDLFSAAQTAKTNVTPITPANAINIDPAKRINPATAFKPS